MAVPITMPAGNENGLLQQWLAKDGDYVRQGDPLLVIETDKITVEVEAPAGGILQIMVPEGQRVATGQALGQLSEQAAAESSGAGAAGQAQGANGKAVGTVAVLREDGVPVASPSARRLAREHGIDLFAVHGSGPGGRIINDDIRLAVAAQQTAPRPATPAPLTLTVPQPAPVQPATPVAQAIREPVAAGGAVALSGMRKAIAEQMARSAQTTAPVTLTATVDMSDARELFERLRPAIEQHYSTKLTLTHLFAKAVARTLELHPALNGQLTDEGLALSKAVNLGIAVALDDGLVVPVLRDANTLSLSSIATRANRLVEQARAGSIPREAASGATFTITNLGAYGIDAFTPVINIPEIAILGIGTVSQQPAVRNGELCVRWLATLSLTFDHRATDGATAARFLQTLRTILEEPDLLVV